MKKTTLVLATLGLLCAGQFGNAVEQIQDSELAAVAGVDSIRHGVLDTDEQQPRKKKKSKKGMFFPSNSGLKGLSNLALSSNWRKGDQLEHTNIMLNEYDGNDAYSLDERLMDSPAVESVGILDFLRPIESLRQEGIRKGNLTTLFGSEGFSYRWEGNIEDVWQNNLYYRVDLNSRDSAGQLEFNNIQGRVFLDSKVHCTTTGRWLGC